MDYISSDTIASVYVGNEPISEIYVGSNKVWPKTNT